MRERGSGSGKGGAPYRRAIGETIRHLRRARSWSLDRLGQAAQLSVSYLSELEHARKEPSGESLERLAAAFDLTLAELLETTARTLEPRPSLPPEALRDLDTAAVAELARYADWLRWRARNS